MVQASAAAVLCDTILHKPLQISPDAAWAFAPAAELRADIEETTPPACLMVYHENMVHFARSVPSYVPAALNDGISGKVIMRPLDELTRSHAVIGGPMTHHMNRHGVRVRKHTPRRGIICKGKVSCDNDGRINALTLNNNSLQAIAAARKLFHEVYGRSAQFQRLTVTNAVVKAVSSSLNWIADTGASMDFIGKRRLIRIDKKRLVKMNDPKRCNTGNGSVTINQTIKANWGDGQQAHAWVMPGDAPPCVSVDQKCQREGWGFYWTSFSHPIFVNPHGTCYEMIVNKNVPSLPGEEEFDKIYRVPTQMLQKMNAMIQSVAYGGDIKLYHHVDGAGGTDANDEPAQSSDARAFAPALQPDSTPTSTPPPSPRPTPPVAKAKPFRIKRHAPKIPVPGENLRPEASEQQSAKATSSAHNSAQASASACDCACFEHKRASKCF